MLTFKTGGVRVRLYFGFFAVLMVYLYIGGRTGAWVEAALICCLLHESGHLAAMLLFGCPPHTVSFYAGGIRISTRGIGRLGRGARAVILSAGCAVNLTLAAASYLLGIERLAGINLALAAFNLLPLPQLDGGRLLRLLSERSC